MEKLDLVLQLLHDFRDEVNRRFDQLEKRFDHLEQEVKTDRKRLDQIYEARQKVKVTFGWQWGAVSMLIAIVAAAIVQVFG